MKKKTDDKKPVEHDSSDKEPVTEIPAADAELVELRTERDRLDAQLQRAMADLQNFRKRQMREFEEIRKRTLEGLAAELLPVLDNFHLALEAHEKHGPAQDIKSMVDGLRIIQTLLHAALERHGVNEIPAAGLAFDPRLHEAVGVEERDDISEGHVAEVIQRGYRLGDKIIRPTRVVVSGLPDTGADTSSSDAPQEPQED
jgi:molecular chaperone GrpE